MIGVRRGPGGAGRHHRYPGTTTKNDDDNSHNMIP